MAASGRRDAAPLTRRLREEPHRFELFQAVRLLELAARRRAASSHTAPPELGSDTPAAREPVRLRASPSLAFPSSQLVATRAAADPAAPPELVASVFGLTGALGSLPTHYTELVLARLRLNDPSLRDFLALFEHRLLSLYYRAFTKYRLAPTHEQAAVARRDGPVTVALLSIAGLGTAGLRGRASVHDALFVRFGASFGNQRRPAVMLEAMLEDYFGLPAKVESFRVDVLTLSIRDRTTIGSPSRRSGHFNRLGDDAVLGRHAHDASGRFRVRIGPVDYATYRRFLPDGDLFRPYCDVIRTYVGPALAFSLRPVLSRGEAPPCRLGAEGGAAPLLGWNAFVRSAPLERTFDGVDMELDRRRSTF